MLIVTSLILRQRNNQFLKNLIQGDWSFMTMFNTNGNAFDKDLSLQPNPKAEFHGRKVMLCVW